MKTKTLILCAMFATLFVFSMNGANALPNPSILEEACDVTPGMTWHGNKCVDESTVGESPAEYREGIEYVVYKQGADQTYSGKKVHYVDVDWLERIEQEYGISLSEVRGLCARNRTTEHNQFGDPYYDKDGKNCWCQVETENNEISGWVFGYDSDTSAGCAQNCVVRCADFIARNAAFRAVILSAVE